MKTKICGVVFIRIFNHLQYAGKERDVLVTRRACAIEIMKYITYSRDFFLQFSRTECLDEKCKFVDLGQSFEENRQLNSSPIDL